MKTIITLGIVSLFAAASFGADVVTKGGATALSKAPSVRAEAAKTAAMDCPKCQSQFVQRSELTFKGATPGTVTVERHQCPGCSTTFTTTGHGKAKVETAVHACSNCKG